MVLVEPRGEVAANRVPGCSSLRAKALGDELQILFQVFLRPGDADELLEAVGGVVGEPVDLDQRDNAVIVSRKGLVLAGVEALLPLWA